MAPTKRTSRKKPAPKKSGGGRRSRSIGMTTPADDTQEQSIGVISPDNVTKLALRQSFESAPNLQTDVHLIWAGSPPQLFTIHSSLLPNKALAILDTSISELHPSDSRLKFRFHTVDATQETFELYRSFLYTGKLFCHDPEGDQDYADNGRDEAHEDREWVRLALSYLLGLKLDDERFRNAAVDGLVEKMMQVDRYPTGLASDIYANTSRGDKFRTLLVDLHVWKGQGTWIDPPHDDANGPMYFRRDVRRGTESAGPMLQDDDAPMPWEVDLCRYHSHNDTMPCERKADVDVTRSAAASRQTASPSTSRKSPRAAALSHTNGRVCKPVTPRRR